MKIAFTEWTLTSDMQFRVGSFTTIFLWMSFGFSTMGFAEQDYAQKLREIVDLKARIEALEMNSRCALDELDRSVDSLDCRTANLATVQPGFRCREIGSGAIWKLVDRIGTQPIWKDERSNLLIGPRLPGPTGKGTMFWREAKAACIRFGKTFPKGNPLRKMKWSLPTAEDRDGSVNGNLTRRYVPSPNPQSQFGKLRRDGMLTLLPEMSNNRYWTSPTRNSTFMFKDKGASGDMGYAVMYGWGENDPINSFRAACVGREEP